MTNQPNSVTNRQDEPRSAAEWITFSIASLILAGIVGLVIAIWVNPRTQQPPHIVLAQSEALRIESGRFYVPFTVTNTGGGTAESVQVIAELRLNGEVVESAEQQIDFLSGGEEAEGAFIFSRDPRQGELTLRAASYKLP